MDKPQLSSSLPRRLPRKPKAAIHPSENFAEDTSLAPNIAYFAEVAEDIEAPSLQPAPEVSIAPPPPTPIKQQALPPSTKITQPAPLVNRAAREQAPPEVFPAPDSENQPDRPSHDDPKPGYARLSGASRSQPSRRSGVSSAVRSSANVPVVRETRRREASEAHETIPLRVSAERPVATSPPQVRQSNLRSVASQPSIPARNDDPTSAPLSRVTKSTSRRARKRKIPAGIALTVLSCILVAYSFTVGSVENEVDRLIVNSESMPAFIKSMLPWLPLLPLILLLGIVLWILAGIIGLRRTRHRVETLGVSGEQDAQKGEAKRRRAPLERFRDEAEKEGIGKDAAYQAWRLLQMYGPDSHILSVYDDLHVTLSMTQQQVQDVYQQLAPSAERTVSARSVLDLMRFVNSPQRATAQRQRTAP